MRHVKLRPERDVDAMALKKLIDAAYTRVREYALMIGLDLSHTTSLRDRRECLVGRDCRQPDDVPVALSGALRDHVKNGRFQIVTSVRGLPLGVRGGLQALFGGKTLDIAEIKAEFQATDVILKPNLPPRRLVAAGCAIEYCLVYYERGGIAHTWHVALFHWTPDATRLNGAVTRQAA